MTEERKPESKPEDLIEATEPNSIELDEQDLDRLSGGCTGQHIKN